MLEQQLGSNTEIVLHDLRRDYDKTIVDIRNGHVTGRKIGGFGSNLGLEVLKGTVKDGDRYNYITRLKDNRVLRSSSLYINNDQGEVIGALCINTDITESLKFEDFIKEYNNYNIDDYTDNEVFVDEVNQLLEHILRKGEQIIGKPAAIMSRDEKIEFVKYIDSKGAFLITKSGEKVQEFLGISKYTMYNYLDIGRNKETKEMSPFEENKKEL
jgi:predicted transcriptional regulator YheO